MVPCHAQLEQQALAQDMKERMDAYRAGKEKKIPLYDQRQRDVEARREAAANAAKGNNPLDREAYHEKGFLPLAVRCWPTEQQSGCE